MAATLLKLDTIEDASVWRDAQGYHAVRNAVVKGLNNTVGYLNLNDAIEVAGMPRYLDVLIGIPAPFVTVVSSVTATAKSTPGLSLRMAAGARLTSCFRGRISCPQ